MWAILMQHYISAFQVVLQGRFCYKIIVPTVMLLYHSNTGFRLYCSVVILK
jgi:hypothetical protein